MVAARTRDKLIEILPDMHKALSDGEVSAFATTRNDPVPCELPAETWFVYELVVQQQNAFVRIFPLNTSSTGSEQELLNLRVKSEHVLQRWPSSSEPRPLVPQTTVGAENQCRRWLVAKMKEVNSQPEAKARLRAQALEKFPGLAKRAFGRAWDDAIRETKAHHWKAPGPRGR